MKRLVLILYLFASIVQAQATFNSLLKNFKPFETPRTNCRPGTVYRISQDSIKYIVQDVKQVKSETSNDGTLIGQMTFSKEELLTMLNINFDSEFITAEVEIRDAVREFTEQANVDIVLWENDVAEKILLDEDSEYFIIRETVATQNITFRFTKTDFSLIVTGKSSLKEKTGESDFPFELNKKFNEAKRFFFLEEKLKNPN
mgnify:CR=1 FL=1